MQAPTVVITSANAATAAMLIPRLRQKGYHIIGLTRGPSPIATDGQIPDWINATAAKQALATADYIIHLSGDANAGNKKSYKAANLDTTRLVADNAARGKCRRIIYLSFANAAPDQSNLYLRYKGQAEELLRSTGKDIVIFRCPVIVDAPGQPSRMDELFLSKNGSPVNTLGDGQQKMRPVYRADVVNAILAALEKGRAGTYELSGMEEMTVDEFIRLANRAIQHSPGSPSHSPHIRHIPAWLAMTLSRFIPKLSPTFADLMLHHTQSTWSPATYQEFGLTATPISQLYDPTHTP